MSVRVRLTRVGSKKNPVWRVVVADQRSPRDGRVIEHVGRYNPQTEPSEVVLNEERLRHWIERGAQPTETVKRLMRIASGEVTPPAPKRAKSKPAAAPAAEGEGEGTPPDGGDAAPAEEAETDTAPAVEEAAEEAPAEDVPAPEEAAPGEDEPAVADPDTPAEG
jgi:small subunit ribosomal protein S16